MLSVDRSSIACVFVLYNPEHELIDVVKRLVDASYPVVLVSNGVSPSVSDAINCQSNIHFIDNRKNIGLASALNVGIRYSFDVLSSKHVIVFDQDSLPSTSMPESLACEFIDLEFLNPASISPRLIDIKKPDASYRQDVKIFNQRDPGTVPTSGTLFSKKSWDAVGPMLEELFIDGIDHEWCFRACDKGFSVCLSSSQTMLHNMGDFGVSFFGAYKPIHRSPIRHYYIIRNTIFLLGCSYIPFAWRLRELLKTIRRISLYPFFSTDPYLTLRLMAKAVLDCFCAKMGPLDYKN